MTKRQKRDVLLQAVIFFITALGCFAVLRFVVAEGDDLFYGRWSRLSPADLLAQIVQHYHRANGRNLVHLIDGQILGSDARLWVARVFLAALLGWIARCGYVLTAPRGSVRAIATAVLFVSAIFLLPVEMTRQSVYWVTGAMNYVFPLALFLTYWTLLRDSIRGRRSYRLTSVFALLAGMTTEQIGVMTFGLTLMMLLYARIWQKKKLPRVAYLPLVLSLAGVLTVVLAPGLRFRAAMTEAPTQGGLLEMLRHNILNLRRNFLFGEAMYPIHFLTLLAPPAFFLQRAIQQKKPVDGLAALFGAGVFLCWLQLPQKEEMLLSYATDVPRRIDLMFLAVLVAYLVITLWAAIASLRKKRPMVLYAWILGVGSQVMMLVMPVSGPRTMLCCAAMQVCFTAVIMRRVPFAYLAVAGAALAWHLGFAWGAAVLVAIAVLLAMEKFLHRRSLRAVAALLCILPLLFCSYTALRETRAGFHTNYTVYLRNRETMRQAMAAGTPQAITLEKHPKELYGWVMPYHNDYYDFYFNVYYGLPQHCEVTWK